jgi:hypothetical protein
MISCRSFRLDWPPVPGVAVVLPLGRLAVAGGIFCEGLAAGWLIAGWLMTD